jgi:hypothetical protein
MTKCASCGRQLSIFNEFKRSNTIYCKECVDTINDLNEYPNQTQLPKQDEPLNCAFQRRFNNPHRVQCALTRIGGGGVIARTLANYEPCLIDICPMYQAWKNKE